MCLCVCVCVCVCVCWCVCVYACQCACIFLCLHIIWINTHRKEALKRLSSCRQQKRQTDLVHQMFCQLHNPFNQCNKQLFQHLSLSPPGHSSSFLSAYWRPSICSFSPLHIFHHSSFFFLFFFFPNESFQAWPLCIWKGPLRVTKTVNQSQITLSGLGHVSLVLNDRKSLKWILGKHVITPYIYSCGSTYSNIPHNDFDFF